MVGVHHGRQLGEVAGHVLQVLLHEFGELQHQGRMALPLELQHNGLHDVQILYADQIEDIFEIVHGD